MDPSLVECEAEREREGCVCKESGLGVLADVRRQYEEMMAMIERRGGKDQLQKQVDLLRSWVGDLVGQNALLVRAVEDLEAEATAKVMVERRRHLEMLCELRAETAALRRRLERKDSDIRGLVEVLRRLREFDYCTLNGIHFYEITESDIFGSLDWREKLDQGDMRNQNASSLQTSKFKSRRNQNKMKQYYAQCRDWEPVKDFNVMLRDEQRKHEERLQQTEANLKSLKVMNVALSEDLHAMKRMCAAMEEQCRAESTRAQFKDDIIREMRRQLKQAKAKVSTSSSWHAPGAGSSTCTTCMHENFLSPDVSVETVECSTSAPVLVPDDAPTPPKLCKNTSCPRFRKIKIHSSSDVKESTRKNSSNGKVKSKPSAKIENVQESHRTSSVAVSGAASGASSGRCSAMTRAVQYHEKLLTTLQILENKDEMIRIQADSIRLAESRISELTSRADDLRQKLQDKCNELELLQATAEYEKKHKASVSITTSTDLQEHQRVVRTLESNLSVIEELYRECFYEAAKQEKLIEMLRSGILDVRLMDKQKDTQIHTLQDVVHSQKWSLERCQDIAMEVDNLKMEISNFLNSSNNDSGMWERDSSPSQADATEDLREISAQLLQLRDMLTLDCTCGLEKENKMLKQANAAMQLRIQELEQQLSERDNRLTEKASVERRLKEDLDIKERELESVRGQLASEKRSSKDQSAECDCLARKLKQTEVLLGDKCAELSSVQRLCAQEQSLVQELKVELRRAANLSEENNNLHDEMQSLRAQVGMWRAQLADSERAARGLRDQLQRARDLRTRLEQQAPCAALQQSLGEAQTRGAALLGDARAVLLAVQRYTHAFRHQRRELEETIKEQQEIIESLQKQLNESCGQSLNALNEKSSGGSLHALNEKLSDRILNALNEKISGRSLNALDEKPSGRSLNALNEKSNRRSLNALNEKSSGRSLNALNEKSSGRCLNALKGKSSGRSLNALKEKLSGGGLNALNEKSNIKSLNALNEKPCGRKLNALKEKLSRRSLNALNEKLNGKSLNALNEKSKEEKSSPCCSKIIPRPRRHKCFETDPIRLVNHSCECANERESATETASGSPAPVPSQKMSRMKSSLDRLCLCKSQRETALAASPAASSSQASAARRDVGYVSVAADPFRRRNLSPTSEMEAEIYEALSRGQQRWTRHRSASHTR